MSSKVGRVSFELPKELIERTSALAHKTGKIRTCFIQEAISLYIEELEKELGIFNAIDYATLSQQVDAGAGAYEASGFA